MATATGRHSNLDRSFKLAARSLLTAFSREVEPLPTLGDAGPTCDLARAYSKPRVLYVKGIRRSYMLSI
jgi:hypothetical protein